MSLNRMRLCAGLSESFTPDPTLNADIERLVAEQGRGSHHDWMDVLEMIYDAGDAGVSRAEIVEQMNALNADRFRTHDAPYLDSMLDILPRDFSNLVNSDGEHFRWIAGSSAEEDDEIDPQTREAIGAQVNLASQSLALMRELSQQGGFTIGDLANRLSLEASVPPIVARQFIEHMLTQFQSMLTRVGNRYMLQPEEPQKTDMQFFRDLEAQARTNPPPGL